MPKYAYGKKPEKVVQAIVENNPGLRAMARKGGEHAAANQVFRKEEREQDLRETALAQAKLFSLSSEGDVQPPDPAVLAAIEEEQRHH